MKAIRVKSYGGPEQLAYIDIARPVPQPHEALVKIDAIAVNSIQSSGSVPPFDAALLAQKGSLYLTRPSRRTASSRGARRAGKILLLPDNEE